MKVGIDIGGTFTDFVFWEGGRLWSHKVPSTPRDPAQAVIEGLRLFPSAEGERSIMHGSTVATNALLEGKGARTALITTRGFRDILEIGRQNRPAIYDLFVDRPPPLVPRNWRFEVDERVNFEGKVLRKLEDSEVEALSLRLRQEGLESVAICFLFSFLYPEHEERVARRLREEGFLVSPSCEILPQYREYERCSTTAINAYLSPVMSRYLSRLEKELGGDLRVMQSNGGRLTARRAGQEAVRSILSGPAGGVVGARYLARLAGFERIITFDMGGTSTDVSLCDGEVQITTESSIGGYPMGVPVINVHSVGAGGGSIAHLDVGGALRVGPQSAGAEPGPACYGLGEEVTVTDAHVALGRIPPDYFLGGRMALQVERARSYLGRLASRCGLGLEETAQGIIEVANSNMGRALRVISVERGFDPAEFVLVSFGGAGGLHACDLARGLSIPQVMIPPNAGILSAFGTLVADVVKDYAQTVMLPSSAVSYEELEALFAPMVQRGVAEVEAEGVPAQEVMVSRLLDMRYVGQSYEVSVPLTPQFVASFHAAHRQLYGHSEKRAETEVVALRLRLIGPTEKPDLQASSLGQEDPREAEIDRREVVFPAGKAKVPLYLWERLKPGHRIKGPAVVVAEHSTALLGANDEGRIDGWGNLLITVGA